MKISVLKIIGLTIGLVGLSAQATPVSQTITKQLMPSAKVDLIQDVATLPLHMGYLKDGARFGLC